MSRSKFKRVDKTWQNFWAYFWRVTHRHRFPGIFDFDQKLVDYCIQALELQPGNRVLDIPCGGGDQAWIFAEKGIEVTGVEISKQLVQQAEKLAKKHMVLKISKFITADMRKLPKLELTPGFDAAVMLSGSFGLLKHKENVKLLHDLFALLRPGGKLLVDSWSPHDFDRDWEQRYWSFIDYDLYVSYNRYIAKKKTLVGEAMLVKPNGEIWCTDKKEEERLRAYERCEWEDMAQESGFELMGFYERNTLPLTPLPCKHVHGIIILRKPYFT